MATYREKSCSFVLQNVFLVSVPDSCFCFFPPRFLEWESFSAGVIKFRIDPEIRIWKPEKSFLRSTQIRGEIWGGGGHCFFFFVFFFFFFLAQHRSESESN